MSVNGSSFEYDAYASFAEHWELDPEIQFLNHGSFGACPRVVLDAQEEFRRRFESRPMHFFVDELEGLIDESRESLGRLLNAEMEDIVFVPNITYGVNTVLRSLRFEAGDELLTTNHAYNACANALRFVAERWGAKVVVVDVGFPVSSSDAVHDAIVGGVTNRTKLALIDHITSPTAVVFPIEQIVETLQGKGVDVLVDGAHGPGMVEVDLKALGAAYYTANCHKWLCSPKGAGFLHIRKDRQELIRPLCISHGANNPRVNRTRLQLEFDWPGTIDPTPMLSIPAAISFLDGLMPGGIGGLMARNREVAIRSARHIAKRLGVGLPVPEEMLGSIVAVRLPDDEHVVDGRVIERLSPVSKLQDDLYHKHGIQTVMNYFPKAPVRYLRVSVQAYNTLRQYEELADVIVGELR